MLSRSHPSLNNETFESDFSINALVDDKKLPEPYLAYVWTTTLCIMAKITNIGEAKTQVMCQAGYAYNCLSNSVYGSWSNDDIICIKVDDSKLKVTLNIIAPNKQDVILDFVAKDRFVYFVFQLLNYSSWVKIEPSSLIPQIDWSILTIALSYELLHLELPNFYYNRCNTNPLVTPQILNKCMLNALNQEYDENLKAMRCNLNLFNFSAWHRGFGVWDTIDPYIAYGNFGDNFINHVMQKYELHFILSSIDKSAQNFALKQSAINRNNSQIDKRMICFTNDMETEINTIMTSGENQLALSNSITIMTSDLISLNDQNWLNNKVIDFYFDLICRRSKENRNSLPLVYAFKITHFLELMNDFNIEDWTKDINFFSYNLIFVPVLKSHQLNLLVVDIENKSIKYYDPLGEVYAECVGKMIDFLYREQRKQVDAMFQINQWNVVFQVLDTPRQQTNSDCGVFVCQYAEHIARRAPLQFTQENIPHFRKCMMYEILYQKLFN